MTSWSNNVICSIELFCKVPVECDFEYTLVGRCIFTQLIISESISDSFDKPIIPMSKSFSSTLAYLGRFMGILYCDKLAEMRNVSHLDVKSHHYSSKQTFRRIDIDIVVFYTSDVSFCVRCNSSLPFTEQRFIFWLFADEKSHF